MADQSVSTACPEYSRMLPLWEKCRDAVAGQDRIKEKRERYLRKPSGMDAEDYEAYIDRAQFFNAAGRTLDGLAGMLGRKVVAVTVPEGMEKYLDNVDGKGHSFSQFVNMVCKDVLTTSWGGVLIDMPQSENSRSEADAERNGFYAYMTYYRAEDCHNWEFGTDGRTQKLRYVIMREPTKVRGVSKYTQEVKDYWRVCEIDENGKYKQTLYNDKLEPTFETTPSWKKGTFSEIPFRFMSLENTPQMPILLDLVNVNLSWYKKSADYENGLHWSGVPTPYERGWLPETKYDKNGNEIAMEPMKLGGTQFLYFPPGTEQVGYLEYSGSGCSSIAAAMSEDKDSMAMLGTRIISHERKGVEAAETAKIHNAAENSVLAEFANNMSYTFEKLLRIYLECSIGQEIPQEEVRVSINTDYDVSTMSPAELTALVSLWQSGGISHKTLFKNLKEGELVDADKTFEDEQAEIDEEQAAKLPAMIKGGEE